MANADHPLTDRLLGDPLSELARKERRALLAASIIAALIAHANLVPQEIAGYGLKFGPIDQRSVVIVLMWVVGYFLISFVLYAFNDLSRWVYKQQETTLQAAVESINRSLSESHGTQTAQPGTVRVRVGPTVYDEVKASFRHSVRWIMGTGPALIFIRGFWELIMPMLVALYALAALYTVVPPKPHP